MLKEPIITIESFEVMKTLKSILDRFEDGYDILNIVKEDLLMVTNVHLGDLVLDLYNFYEDNGDDLIIGYFDMELERNLTSSITKNNQGSGAK